MSEERVPYGYRQASESNYIVINHDSWTIKLYRKKRSLSIESLDYHAGPLILSRDDLTDLALKMGLHVRSRRRKKLL